MKIILILLVVVSPLLALETIINLSDKIGPEIDAIEREQYHLFPDVDGFINARIIEIDNKTFNVELTIESDLGKKTTRQPISNPALEATKLHVEMVEQYLANRNISSDREAETLYKLGLKYSAKGNYKISPLLFKELTENYPESIYAGKAIEFSPKLQSLNKTRSALFLPGVLVDQNGRTELLIFSGYYGIWLGMATPSALEVDSPQVFALGLLLGGPVSFLITYNWTKNNPISESRANMISLGGHLGTWQGIGWAAVNDAKGSTVVGLGEIAGLAGIATAVAITSNNEFATAHAAWMNYSMYWGAWFGLVFGNVTKSNDILRDMLIGTDVALASTAILTNNLEMSKTRYRLINLAGVFGTIVGFGFDLLVEVDNAETAFAIAGIGSVAGLIGGTMWTRNFDNDKKYSNLNKSNNWSFASTINLQPHPIRYDEMVPSFTLSFSK